MGSLAWAPANSTWLIQNDVVGETALRDTKAFYKSHTSFATSPALSWVNARASSILYPEVEQEEQ